MTTYASAGTGSTGPARPVDGRTPVSDGGLASGGRILVRGITAVGYHGVYPSERRSGQRFVVDLVCHLDVRAAAASDGLTDTVDYAELAARVAADVAGDPLNLIEALAARIGRTCLTYPQVTSVEVTVHKPDVSMPVDVDGVAVQLTMSRPLPEAGEPYASRPR